MSQQSVSVLVAPGNDAPPTWLLRGVAGKRPDSTAHVQSVDNGNWRTNGRARPFSGLGQHAAARSSGPAWGGQSSSGSECRQNAAARSSSPAWVGPPPEASADSTGRYETAVPRGWFLTSEVGWSALSSSLELCRVPQSELCRVPHRAPKCSGVFNLRPLEGMCMQRVQAPHW